MKKLKNKLIAFCLVSLLILPIILPIFKIQNVFASNTFTTCTLKENSYIRADAGSNIKYTDVDGKQMLINSPKRIEVLGSKVVNGQEYKKIKANYYSNNYVGWISMKYLTDFKDYTLDGNYANTLRGIGFPESYILPLQKLHAVYKNWNFVPSKIGNGLDFNTAVINEYQSQTKNFIDSPIVSLRSTEGDSYRNGKFTPRDNGSWYSASKQTIAFYMDPRNWLFDVSTVFMFEDLSYNTAYEGSYNSLVKTILSGSFMDSDTYVDYFVSAGKAKGVSPVHLASRALQEQGKSGSATSLGNGYNGNNIGYYNFFNISAYGSNTSAIINNALNVAKNNGWDTPYKSILAGAGIISQNYINVGQNTLYYQKFNTIYSENNSLYNHQYMTNVRVSVSESINTYESYKSKNAVNSDFTFRIPVYQNLPAETSLYLSQNIVQSNNTTTNNVTSNNNNNSSNSILSNSGMNVSSNTVSGITAGVTANEIENNIKNNSNASVTIKDSNGNKVNDKLSTGNQMIIVNNNSTSVYTVIVSGDINGDGRVSIADFALVKSNMLGNNTLNEIQKKAADMNKDGKISIADIALIKSHILK